MRYSPGPNILVVSLIGWQMAGLAGLLVATSAIMAPSCSLAFLVGRGLARWSESRWVRLLKDALIPVALGLILASGLSMMRIADGDRLSWAISLATAAFVLTSRRNPLWAVAAGTCLNVAGLHAGLLR